MLLKTIGGRGGGLLCVYVGGWGGWGSGELKKKKKKREKRKIFQQAG